MSRLSRRRNALSLYETHVGPNMTPMVDVVMVILIFFMASAAFLGPEWFLRTALPGNRATDAPAAHNPPRIVRIGLVAPIGAANAVATIDGGDPIPLDRATEELRAIQRNQPESGLVIVVDPAADASYDAVVRIHEICASLGITRVGLAPRREPPAATDLSSPPAGSPPATTLPGTP